MIIPKIKDLEQLSYVPNAEGVTRPDKEAKTKKYKLRVIGMGSSPLILSTYAESKEKAIKYAKARWKDCLIKVVEN